ncbi:MAG: Rieske 2Fe-2S domain-containing protein [Isosphaeraceae bacterium]
MWTRRDLYRYGSWLLGGAMSLGLAIPGVAYVLDPLRKRGESGTTQRLTRLSALKVGEPQSFAVIAERQDAWVKYPPEPIGTVWLVRQPEGAKPPVIAFTAECPHLGCAIVQAPDAKSFICPCHRSIFDLKGKPQNDLSPRSMDTLDVELTTDDDPAVVVRFTRFRTQTKEKIPLV